MKLVFKKYMEFEDSLGNQSKLNDLKRRVEDYLTKTFDKKDESEEEDASMESGDEQEEDQEMGSSDEN